MPLETPTFVMDLVETNPPGTDGKNQGDNHIRNIKLALKNTFPTATRAFNLKRWAEKEATFETQAADRTMLSTDDGKLEYFDCSAAGRTYNLLAVASAPEGMVVFIDRDGSANTLTIDPAGIETINGAATYVFKGGETGIIYRAASEWRVISYTRRPATQAEVAAGADALQPIVPSTLAGILEEAYLDAKTAAASATINFVLTAAQLAAYRAFRVRFIGVVPATDNVSFLMRTSTDGGATFDSGAGTYSWNRYLSAEDATSGVIASASDTSILIANAVDNAATSSLNGYVILSNPTNTTLHKQVQSNIDYISNGDLMCRIMGSGRRKATADIDAFEFRFSAGNIAAGVFVLSGIK